MAKNELNNTDTASPPTYSLNQHAYLTLTLNDRLRLFRFPPTIIDAVRQAIIVSWPLGLQREGQDVEFYEFKVNGNPWWGDGECVVPAGIMMLHVFSALHSHGWYLLITNDLCRLAYDRNSLVFQLGVPPSPTSFFAIARYQLDKLRLICVPPELIPAVQNILGETNIQREEWLNQGACYQLKIRDKLWTGDETPVSRARLLAILDCFSSLGWQLHTGIHMNGIAENSEADTWFFRQKTQ